LETVILIPAYNESKQIGPLLERLTALGLKALVIDDGSTDGTGSVAESKGATVITHASNMGKGASLKTGFEHILRSGGGAEQIIVMDADGQHAPEEISKFLDAATIQKDVLVIGNRMGNPEMMPLDRKLTNRFMSFIVSSICGQRIPDTQCGFRLLKKDLLKSITIEFSRFEVESELLIKAARAGKKIVSVPIQALYGKEKSQIKAFPDTIRFITFLFRLPFVK